MQDFLSKKLAFYLSIYYYFLSQRIHDENTREDITTKDKISNAIRKASKEVSKELNHNEIMNITSYNLNVNKWNIFIIIFTIF